jgi:hypothetical protein
MMIRKRMGTHNICSQCPQCSEELFRLSDTGKRQYAAILQLQNIYRNQPGAQNRSGEIRQDEIIFSSYHNGIRARETLLYGFAHRPRRQYTAVTESLPRIYDDERQIFSEREVLVTVVHYDDIYAFRFRQLRSGGAVRGDDYRRGGGKHQRFISNFGGSIRLGVDHRGPAHAAAVAPSENADTKLHFH